jgi:hypothetical protein
MSQTIMRHWPGPSLLLIERRCPQRTQGACYSPGRCPDADPLTRLRGDFSLPFSLPGCGPQFLDVAPWLPSGYLNSRLPFGAVTDLPSRRAFTTAVFSGSDLVNQSCTYSERTREQATSLRADRAYRVPRGRIEGSSESYSTRAGSRPRCRRGARPRRKRWRVAGWQHGRH